MFKHFSLSILAGLLLFVSWPPITSFTFLIFFALVPLFLIEQAVFENQIRHRRYFFYTYLAICFEILLIPNPSI